MKPWQVAVKDAAELCDKSNTDQREIVAQDERLSSKERIEGLNTLFELRKDYWKIAGMQNPFVIQFCITDKKAESWFVKVDAQDANATEGIYDGKPTVTWTSDFEILEGVFQGKVPSRDRFKIDGDFNTLKTFFTVAYQNSPYSS